MLKLKHLIGLAGIPLDDFKIHFAMGGDNVVDIFLAGDFKEWQEGQTKRNFQCEYVLSLIRYGSRHWLFAGVFRVNGVKPRGNHYTYDTTEVPGLEHLTGRVIVEYKKSFRLCYVNGSKYADDLIVSEMLPHRLTVADFPGYNSIRISHGLLKTIVGRETSSWKSPLASVSGVYVITDTETGKQYVGSASGQGGIWARWCSYAKSGHGGNKELRALLRKKGPGYVENFQFSLLEICDLQASEEEVGTRESHWKNVLCTRHPLGYNRN